MSIAMNIDHANRHGLGSRLEVIPFPPKYGKPGGVWLSIYAQAGSTWETKAANFILSAFDVAQVLQVLRGMTESINYGTGIAKNNDCTNALLKFEHQIEPAPGYMLTICETANGVVQTRTITLCCNEALVLMLGLEGVMANICFGEV